MATGTVTNAGRNLYRDSSSGAANPRFYYIAVGTGASTPDVANTMLDNEVFRKAITSFANGASPGETIASLYIGPDEANGFTIAEYGLFGGSSATNLANSGVLIARWLYSPTHLKAANESMVLPVDLTFT